jgi:hypothetical protein
MPNINVFVGFEVLTAVSMKIAVFWVVAPCSLGNRPDDGGSKDLGNVGKLPPDYTVLQPRRQQSSSMSLVGNVCAATYQPSGKNKTAARW